MDAQVFANLVPHFIPTSFSQLHLNLQELHRSCCNHLQIIKYSSITKNMSSFFISLSKEYQKQISSSTVTLTQDLINPLTPDVL